jgi:hypothetical protein
MTEEDLSPEVADASVESPSDPDAVARESSGDSTDPSTPSAADESSDESVASALGPDEDSSGAETHELVHLNQPSEALPVLARATAEAWLRVAAWGIGTSLRVGAQLAKAASDPSAATHFYGEMTVGLRDYAREFLGITELEHDVSMLGGIGAAGTREKAFTESALRAQGAELLRAAADVGFDEAAHPAYARFLGELAPDEARLLRLLASAGPQPLVDVRASNLIGMGSQLIAASMNMLGRQAGLRYRDRVPIYLANISRLDLIATSDEPIEDPIIYQVLEAQPDVLGTIKQTPRAKTVHRSVVLTALGEDFCAVCLPGPVAELTAGEPE